MIQHCTIKCIRTNICHAIRYSQFCKALQDLNAFTTNNRYAIPYSHGLQCTAILFKFMKLPILVTLLPSI